MSPVQFAECSRVATFACADCADRDSDIPVVAAASVTTCVTSSVTRPSMVTCPVCRVTCPVSRVPCHVSIVFPVFPAVTAPVSGCRLVPVSTLHVELGHFLSAPGVQSPHPHGTTARGAHSNFSPVATLGTAQPSQPSPVSPAISAIVQISW